MGKHCVRICGAMRWENADWLVVSCSVPTNVFMRRCGISSEDLIKFRIILFNSENFPVRIHLDYNCSRPDMLTEV